MPRRVRAIFGTLLLAALPVLAAAPRLKVNGETLLGVDSPTPGISAFLGIPFAEPPLGARRWDAPRPWQGKGGTREATRFAPACMQTMRILEWYRGMAEDFGGSRAAFPDLAISEDCLYLNVWAPREPPHKPLPVMVYLHGGSNNSGWPFEPNYHGHALAARGVVVVTVAYRLGVFGFFSHPELEGQQAEANFGLWDQLAALDWVQRHIARFGGDPRRVTVFGESAGAGDAGLLMLSPGARGKLHRVIMQSGANIGLPDARTLVEEQQRGLQLGRALGETTGIEALRALPAARLLALAEDVYKDHYHAPVVDGRIVTEQTRARLASRDFPVGQLLIGTNGDEWYASAPADADASAVAKAVAEARTLHTAAVHAELARATDARRALDRLRTADGMLCPAQYLATRLAETGREVWMYRFTRVREGAAAARLGAYHGAELPYVFGTHDAWMPTAAADRALGATMMDYWVTFARDGDPNHAGAPHWPAWRAPRFRVQQLDAEVRSVHRPEAALCTVWEEAVGRDAGGATR